MATYDLTSTPLRVLLDAPDARAVIDALLPELPAHPMIQMAYNMNADSVLTFAAGAGDPERVTALRDALNQL